MTEELLYWQKEDYEPNWDDFFTEWEAGNADYVNDWYADLDDCDDWEYPRNPFIKAVSEGRVSFAAQLTGWIEEGEEFYDEMMDYCTGNLDMMTLIIDNSRWYKCDAVAEIYEGLKSREYLRQEAQKVESKSKSLEERVEELEEELDRLRAILNENGIDY